MWVTRIRDRECILVSVRAIVLTGFGIFTLQIWIRRLCKHERINPELQWRSATVFSLVACDIFMLFLDGMPFFGRFQKCTFSENGRQVLFVSPWWKVVKGEKLCREGNRRIPFAGSPYENYFPLVMLMCHLLRTNPY